MQYPAQNGRLSYWVRSRLGDTGDTGDTSTARLLVRKRGTSHVLASLWAERLGDMDDRVEGDQDQVSDQSG
jgi:hypothetical protein